jgi:hypothetical protein
MEMKKGTWAALVILAFFFLNGCAGMSPVRDEFKVDYKIPLGKIEGNKFTGIRYPYNVSAPSGWVIATRFPDFMLEQGYYKEGLQTSQLFIYNPTTKSNLQFDFETADRYTVFSQPMIQSLASSVGEETVSDTKAEPGAKDVVLGPTEPFALKGVPYAAKKYVTYSAKGEKREQGWIYAFAEPYQIFILYSLIDKEGVNDRPALKEILDSFEYFPKK